MLRFSAYALAALAMVSIFAVTIEAKAGNDDQRRVRMHQAQAKHQKHRTIRMRDVNADSRRDGGQRLENGRKRFNRSTLSLRVADRDNRHRHHARVRVNTSSVVVINVVGDRGYRMPANSTRTANTYSGAVDVYSIPGVGTYSYSDAVYNGHAPDGVADASAPSLKIIDVGALKPNEGCDMQAGVCVIRP